MGRFKCLSKPIKRIFFAYANTISDKWIKIVSNKYIFKYINKINKINRKNNINNNYNIEIFNLKLINSHNYHRVPGLINFKHNLNNDLNNEKGLAHSKVREYWLRRGPRLIIILLLTIIITILFSALLIERTLNDYIFSILVGINLILCSLYMLYQRLIDSISGAMMRIGHEHYTKWKRGTLLIKHDLESKLDKQFNNNLIII